MALGEAAGAVESESESVPGLRRVLLDRGEKIERRISALFSLRNVATRESVEALEKGMLEPSALLAHESAFALGQMGQDSAISALTAVLLDPTLHPVVRHEAAEALGNLGGPSTLQILRRHLSDNAAEVRETCQLAVHRLETIVPSQDDADAVRDDKSGAESREEPRDGAKLNDFADHPGSHSDLEDLGKQKNFVGVDPSITLQGQSDQPSEKLRETLLDEAAPLWNRYGALFVLRDRATEKKEALASEAIIQGLHHCQSALLKHEIAYVLGQLQDPSSVSALSLSLADSAVHPMVRHEAAVALGSVADRASMTLLTSLLNDPEPLVAESCAVALDMMS